MSKPINAWVPFKFIEPSHDGWYLVWQGKEFRICNYSKDNNEFSGPDPKIYGEITHWADLPSPPAEQQQ